MRDPDSKLGVITRGSLTEGIEMKLAPERSVEEIKAGKFVLIEGEQNDFFCLVEDVRLEATDPKILLNPPAPEDRFFRQVLSGTNTYVTVCLRPTLVIPLGKELNFEEEPQPVKTIPPHFSSVYLAEEQDVSRVFGSESLGDRFFSVGTPLDMETPVCLDLDRFIERSNGLFGKTGTGKTFLTRLILSGLIKNEKAVNLIFDMHNEYGWQGQREAGKGKGGMVKGLKPLFGSQVAIFTLDPESTRRRGVQADHEVWVSYDQIEVEDVTLLQDELGLHQTAVESASLIYAKYGSEWLQALLEQDGETLKDFAQEVGGNFQSISALHRKLKRLERLPFLRREGKKPDVVDRIMEFVSRGIHIVLEFGRQNSLLCYLLVANILTRRIHDLYVTRTEHYLATHAPEDRPRQLMITVEEAHKFLNPQVARQTIFGTIARELRKYFVSLLIVDQRPSGIDDEVLSQIGTRMVALLNDERDIQAVLTGVPNAAGLRGILSSLESKQQALLFGHAVPMPVVIKTRNYDEKFYTALGLDTTEDLRQRARREAKELFG